MFVSLYLSFLMHIIGFIFICVLRVSVVDAFVCVCLYKHSFPVIMWYDFVLYFVVL